MTQRPPSSYSILAQSATKVLAALALQWAALAHAEGVAYKLKLEAPKALAELLEANLDLSRWRGNPRLDRDQLQRLVRGAPEQVKTLVATEGYYAPLVTAVLETEGPELLARIHVELGEPVRVAEVELELDGVDAERAASLRKAWSLPVGRVFRQGEWEQAKRNLLRLAASSRYPRAQLGETSAVVDPDTRHVLLKVALAGNGEVHLGGLRIEGLQRYPDSVISNLNLLSPGDEYNEAALQAFQARLQDTGYFSGVEVAADLSQAGAIVPLLVRVTENKIKAVSLGLGYSTNTGNRAQATFDDLSVFGLRLKSGITLETRRQAAKSDFYLPTSPAGYNDSVGASFERNDLNGEVTSVSTLAGKRVWGTPLLERSMGLEYLNERKTVGGAISSSSQSLPLSYNWTQRQLDNLILPSSGYVLHANLAGAVLPILTTQAFVRGDVKAIWYRPMGPRSSLILRGEAGALASRGTAGVPATYLFRAGGDQSVRGYGYQQLGVRQGSAITGGRYLLAGSVEYQYWFDPPWGAAVFYDAGNAGDVFKDLKPRAGYGLGARWRSPVGPINIDAAYGQALHKYRLHFSLGFTF